MGRERTREMVAAKSRASDESLAASARCDENFLFSDEEETCHVMAGRADIDHTSTEYPVGGGSQHPGYALRPQKSWGNLSIMRYLSYPIQAKPLVGRVGDPYEEEADRTAEEIVDTENEEIADTSLPRQVSGASAAPSAPPWPGGPPPGDGQPLSDAMRSYFEPRFGRDFSHVRIHAGGEGDHIAAGTLGARAFATGHHIVFGAGEYAPEEKRGRLLLAHELAHVVQQADGARSAPAIQRVEGGQWREEHEAASREAAARAASARIEGDTEYWEGYAMTPDEAALEIVLRSVIADKGLKGAVAFVMNYKFRFGWSPAQAALRERIIPILDKKLKDLEDYARTYVDGTFGPKAVSHLKTVLADSRKVVEKEAQKYGLTEKTTRSSYSVYGGGMSVSSTSYTLADNAETGGMVSAAKDIIAKYNELGELNKKRESYEEKTYGCIESEESGMRLKCTKQGVTSVKITNPEAHKAASEQIEKFQQSYAALLTQYESSYPVLASFRPPQGLHDLKVIAEGQKGGRDMVIGMDIAAKRRNIEEIQKVADDNKFVWKQESIMNGAKRELAIQPGSLEDKAVDAKVQEVADSELIRSLTLGFISLIGALMAAIPSGGSSLVAWGAGGAGAGLLVGAGGTSIYEGIREYQIQKAATGTAFDKAQAISQQDPSLFWLAFMIVMSVADIAVAAAFFAKAAAAVRAVDKALELEEAARKAYQTSGLVGKLPEEEFVAKYKANVKPSAEAPKKATPGEGPEPEGPAKPPKEKAPGEEPKAKTPAEEPKKPAEAPSAAGLASLPKPGTILARGSSEDAVRSVYHQAMRENSPYGVEVGVYRRTLADGSEEYAVVQGMKGQVSAPGDEWINVSHFHPEAEARPGFQNPAPQDMSAAARDSIRRPEAEQGPFVQKVHSIGKDGKITEVQYGVENGKYFVKRPGQPTKYFVETYPDSIRPQVNATGTIADADARLDAQIKIFKTLDPDKYYAGWWARQL